MDDAVRCFYSIFEALPRQGPGDDEVTRRALDLVRGRLPQHPRILDVGCGSGASTRVLSRELAARVFALDNHLSFLLQLRLRSGSGALARLTAGTMQELPFLDGGFDLIWSEGAIYVLGIREGLRRWRRLLKPSGTIVVSDAVRLGPIRESDAAAFWQSEIPGLRGPSRVAEELCQDGWRVLHHFTLDPAHWLENYYGPLRTELDRRWESPSGDPAAREVVELLRREIEMFERSDGAVSYEFWCLAPA